MDWEKSNSLVGAPKYCMIDNHSINSPSLGIRFFSQLGNFHLNSLIISDS